jgi:hypothetical protein
MTTMSSTGAAVNFQGEARAALRGAGLAWILMGLSTLLMATCIGEPDTILIKPTVPVIMLVLAFGLALISAGIFAWRGARIAAYVGLGLGYLSLLAAIAFLYVFIPLAVLSIVLGHRALWLAAHPRQRGDADAVGAGGVESRRADWTAAAIARLAIGPLAGMVLGFVFGWLATSIMVVARLEGGFYGLTVLGGAFFSAMSMGAGAMLGGLIGGATLGWERFPTRNAAFFGGVVVGLLPFVVTITLSGSPQRQVFERESWAAVLFIILRLAVAGGLGGLLGAAIARMISRALRPEEPRVPKL